MKNKKTLFWLFTTTFVVCAFSTFVFFANNEKIFQDSQNAADSENEAERLSINPFEPIQGTSIFIATVESKEEVEWTQNINARWFSFDYSYSVRNLIFLDGNTLSSHYLFDTNENYIVDTSQFPTPSPYSNADTVEVKWLVYKIVHGDTNSDGIVNRKDSFSLAMSNANGQNYLEFIEDVDGLYGMDLLGEHYLVVVYKTDGENFASKIDLNEQITLETQKLEKVP